MRNDLAQRYGPWALVTGASAGIGEGFCERLARAGLNLVLVARRRDRLESLARRFESGGSKCRVVVADLAEPSAAAMVVEAVRDLDVGLLVNNAGTGWIGRFDLQTPESLVRLVRLHCETPVELTSRMLPAMSRRKHSGVILVASAGAYVPMPYYAVYGGTKAFLAMWGEALAAELTERGTDVLVVAPGDTRTEFQEVAGEQSTRWSRVDDVVAASLEALGRDSRVVPGLENRLGVLAARFLPRRLVVRMMRSRQRAQTPPDRR
jgi:short-subunit dehydrogenase